MIINKKINAIKQYDATAPYRGYQLFFFKLLTLVTCSKFHSPSNYMDQLLKKSQFHIAIHRNPLVSDILWSIQSNERKNAKNEKKSI